MNLKEPLKNSNWLNGIWIQDLLILLQMLCKYRCKCFQCWLSVQRAQLESIILRDMLIHIALQKLDSIFIWEIGDIYEWRNKS